MMETIVKAYKRIKNKPPEKTKKFVNQLSVLAGVILSLYIIDGLLGIFKNILGISLLSPNMIILGILTIFLIFSPIIITVYRDEKRIKKLIQQLIQIMPSLSDACQKGLSLKTVISEQQNIVQEPLKSELATVSRNLIMGESFSNAINGIAKRNDVPDIIHACKILGEAYEKYGSHIHVALDTLSEMLRAKQNLKQSRIAEVKKSGIMTMIVACVLVPMLLCMVMAFALNSARQFEQFHFSAPTAGWGGIFITLPTSEQVVKFFSVIFPYIIIQGLIASYYIGTIVIKDIKYTIYSLVLLFVDLLLFGNLFGLL